MKLESLKMSSCMLLGLVLFAPLPAARASLIFTLNQDACTGSCGLPPFATVTLTQDSPTQVTIVETLSSDEVFAKSGAGDALEFNLVNAGAIIGNISTGFAIGPAPDKASAFGDFLQSITCTLCSGGNPGNPPGPLTFTVSNALGISINDFKGNTGGYFFAADIVGNNGNTGNVASFGGASQSSPPPTAPEPMSFVLAGAGLLGVVTLRARRTRTAKFDKAATQPFE